MASLLASVQGMVQYLVPVLLLALGAVGWFVRRRVTSAGTVEKLDLAAKLFDVRAKLLAPDLTNKQIDNILSTAGIERSMFSDFAPLGAGARQRENESEPLVLSTTAAMGARLDAELNVLEARIEQKILDIEILSSHNASLNDVGLEMHDPNHIAKMYRAWRLYRRRAGNSVMADYLGGTIAGPMFLAEEIRISEAFLADLEERFENLKM